MSTTGERVTYATLAAGQTEDFRRKFDEALSRLVSRLGEDHPHRIAGPSPTARSELFEDRSPADTRTLIGRFPVGTPEDVDRAVAAARNASAQWRGRPWRDRAAILHRAADLIEERGFDLCALVSLERIEAGVVYVNRRAGATTGAWPGVQPFSGWKGSGSSGKASGGLYYVQQFMREQSRTIVH